VDATGRIVFASCAAEQLFGHPDGALTGRDLSLVLNVPPAPHAGGALAACLGASTGRTARITGRHRDGTTLLLAASFTEHRRDGRVLLAGLLRPISAPASPEVRRRRRRTSRHLGGAAVATESESATPMKPMKARRTAVKRKRASTAGLQRTADTLRRSRDQLHALAMKLLSIREEEQTRIARDLHDELGQALTVLKMQLAALGAAAPDGNDVFRTKLHGLGEMVDQMVQAVRRIATQLRPAALDHLGLAAGMEWQAADFQARTGIVCALDADLREPALTPAASTAIFRIVQEALTNVARHSQARRVSIRLGEHGGDIVLEIVDDGVGLGATARRPGLSLGLLGMHERAVLLGGRAEVAGAAGFGTSVRVRIPRSACESESALKS
jgi:signal transduction histidine kinase